MYYSIVFLAFYRVLLSPLSGTHLALRLYPSIIAKPVNNTAASNLFHSFSSSPSSFHLMKKLPLLTLILVLPFQAAVSSPSSAFPLLSSIFFRHFSHRSAVLLHVYTCPPNLNSYRRKFLFAVLCNCSHVIRSPLSPPSSSIASGFPMPMVMNMARWLPSFAVPTTGSAFDGPVWRRIEGFLLEIGSCISIV